MNKQSLRYLRTLLLPVALVLFLNTNANLVERNDINAPVHLLNERVVKLKIDYKFSIKGPVELLKVKMVIPETIANRQTINKISFSVQPDSIYVLNSNKYALFTFHDVDKNFKIAIKCNLTIFSSIKTNNDHSDADLSKYLVAEKNIEIESPKIIETAASLKQKTDIETVIKTFDYVSNSIRYEVNDAIGAEKVLETKVGKCMDYSDLFVALLRANKIPAKSIIGMVVDYDGDNPLHAWPEAYLKKQGWVRFDPTTGHSEISKSGDNYVMQISNKYITLSEGRNDIELHANVLEYSYKSNAVCTIKVNSSFDIAGQDNQNDF